MRNIENGKFGKECVITDMGLSRIFDLNKTYQTTKAATFPLKVSSQIHSLLFIITIYFFGCFLIKFISKLSITRFIFWPKSQNFDYS